MMKALISSSAAHIWRAAPRECSAAAAYADSQRSAERFTAFCCFTADPGKLAAALPVRNGIVNFRGGGRGGVRLDTGLK
jgi:hypothetical protein